MGEPDAALERFRGALAGQPRQQLRHAKRSVASNLRLRKDGPMLPGLDVSSFQGLPAQWRGHAGSFAWAAVKTTEHQPDGSTYINPDADADWAFLEQQGKGRVAYTFGHPGSSAGVTAAAFLAELGRLGLRDADGVALDLEVTDGQRPPAVAAWAADVAGLITRVLERPVLLYTFLSFAGAGNCAGLGHLPLWIADPSSAPGSPRIPAPWKAHAIHQYAITGAIDRDLAAYPSVAAMSAALGKRTDPSPPAAAVQKEEPMLLNKGAGAMTPVAIPRGATGLRFVSAGDALLHVEFHGHGAREVRLTWASGSHRLAAPQGVHAARISRGDSGTGDVSVTVE